MKIHYISHHSILEYDEVQLLTDLGHDVFANGAYLDPAGHITLPRPGIKGAKYHTRWAELAREHPKTALPDELLDPFDVIVVMHQPNVIVQNWDKLRGRRVIWRSIGQSTHHIEKQLKRARDEGLEIIRYSPKECNIRGYIGEDAMIRFYKDPEVFQGWVGDTKEVVNFSQSLMGRRTFCHYEEIIDVIKKFEGTVYGPGNEDLGQFNGGEIPFEQQLAVMQSARAMVYGGTWPAPYTLSFIEAMMMGLPVVAISKALAHLPNHEDIDFYEVDEMMAQVDGPVCDNVSAMFDAVHRLREDREYARELSAKQRAFAIDHFGKEKIAAQWKELLDA